MHFLQNILTVSSAEQGMKLLGFLARRCGGAFAQNELHRWIRTGQVRVNGGRSRPFDRLRTGDAVRLPPFAAQPAKRQAGGVPEPAPGEDLGSGVVLLAVTDEYLVLEKPAGLPSQPGSGHEDSVADCLKRRFSACDYVPAPVHRLDKDTSGLLLAGRTHEAQEMLHALFMVRQENQTGGVEKIYMVWVGGLWPYDGEELLRDFIAKKTERKKSGAVFESMRVALPCIEQGKEARSRVTAVVRRESPLGPVSLLRVAIETGRTHQVRVQFASRGFPVVGDAKYGGPTFPRMLLHAASLLFLWRGRQVSLRSRPNWSGPFMVQTIDGKS